MRKKLMALVALAIAFSAPGASAAASHTEFDCGLTDIAEETTTGGQDTFTGVAYGYAVSLTPGDAVDIACYIRVDGTAVTSTFGDGASTQLDAFAQQVTYTAADTQDVDLCADVYVNGVLDATACFETSGMQVPPQEIVDLLALATDPLVSIANALTGGCTTALNSGTCDRGICLVNSGWCDGGICLVNAGYCGRGCVAAVNLGGCGAKVHT